jgi:hypothetical protein
MPQGKQIKTSFSITNPLENGRHGTENYGAKVAEIGNRQKDKRSKPMARLRPGFIDSVLDAVYFSGGGVGLLRFKPLARSLLRT